MDGQTSDHVVRAAQARQCFRWRRRPTRLSGHTAYRYETDDQTRHVRPGMYTRNVDVVSCPDSLQAPRSSRS